MRPHEPSRRRFVGGMLALPVLGLGACGRASSAAEEAAAPSGPLAPTAGCADADDLTASQTEGPYFTPNSPERTSLLAAGAGGTRLSLTGLVLATSCQPIGRALLDFWQCDETGNYDNAGYRYRGHQFTDAAGRFTLETVVPGLYPGRTRHIHVKVQAPSGPILTTQLYFPGETRNGSDGIFRSDLLLRVQDAGGARQATFTFVVRT